MTNSNREWQRCEEHCRQLEAANSQLRAKLATVLAGRVKADKSDDDKRACGHMDPHSPRQCRLTPGHDGEHRDKLFDELAALRAENKALREAIGRHRDDMTTGIERGSIEDDTVHDRRLWAVLDEYPQRDGGEG